MNKFSVMKKKYLLLIAFALGSEAMYFLFSRMLLLVPVYLLFGAVINVGVFVYGNRRRK
jgi:hypothetical protein